MNGWGFAAVAVVCVTVLGATLLWALVRLGQQQRPADHAVVSDETPGGVEELSADEEFQALQAYNADGRAELRRQVVEAAERSRRGQDGE
ncbi:hypothetical protein ACWET9_11985 [Streptomyces sp. NPDC004059]